MLVAHFQNVLLKNMKILCASPFSFSSQVFMLFYFKRDNGFVKHKIASEACFEIRVTI